MELQNLLLFVLLAILLVVSLITILRFFTERKTNTGDISVQLIDIKNQLNELKTKQLESQKEALQQQQDNLRALLTTINEILSTSQRTITEQLGNTGKIVGDINTKLGALEQTAKNMQEIGKDISSLQDILAAPKLRGNIGEFLLEELLRQILPANNYQMQYSFKNGTKVDAAITLGDRIIPVDSKFPLEDFKRIIDSKTDEEKKRHKRAFIQNVKKKIDDIRSKYINQDENTYDFALMYIPAENVFYETIISDTLSESKEKEYEIFHYAIQNKVIPVSPNSFYSYLMAIAYGLKGLKIEQQARELQNGLAALQETFKKFNDEYAKTGKHLKSAQSSYDSSQRQLSRFNDKISAITGARLELIENNGE